MYGNFKRQTSEISPHRTLTWPRKESHKRKTESLLIAGQNNAIRMNYVKANIDKTQQNSKSYQSHIKRIQQTHAKKYKTRHEWVGKEIHRELCHTQPRICPGDCDAKREKLSNSGFCCSGWPESKNKGKGKKDKYLDRDRELKKNPKIYGRWSGRWQQMLLVRSK